MSDRYIAFTVTLEIPTKDEDAEPIINAIRQIRGVSDVVPHVDDIGVHWAYEKARLELVGKLLELLRPDVH